MVAVRNVPHQTGARYTFSVKRYELTPRPGWKVVRVLGQFWHLPPDTLKYYTVEQISQFYKLADERQRSYFECNIMCRAIGKTRDTNEPGIYWTGTRAYQVHGLSAECHVTPFNGPYKGVIYSGVFVSFPDAPELDYILSVEKDVSITTFYKYLLFYTRYVRVTSAKRDWFYKHLLPYNRERGLDECSIESFNNAPQPSLTPA